jgi:hypothetical protein
MLNAFSVVLAFATVVSISPTQAKERFCSAAQEKKMIEQCGGYVVWINSSRDKCTYGFKGDHFYYSTRSGYLACEQTAQRLGCRRPLSNQ